MSKVYYCFFVLFGFSHIILGQSNGDYRTVQDGNWNSVNTWQVYNGGAWRDLSDASAGVYMNVIPTSASGEISILSHEVDIPNGYTVTIDQTSVAASGRLDVETGGSLIIAASADALTVNGDLVARDLSSITGTASTRVTFNAGSNYYHLFGATQGVIPLATWNSASNLLIRGYSTFTTATSTGNWTQSFGNVEWRCPLQANAISLAGLFRTITGDLSIVDTNGEQLFLSTTSHPTINISGDLNVEGNSAMVVATSSSTTTIVNIGGDFNFNPTSGLTSYLSTTGATIMNILGDFEMDAGAATLNLANSTTSSGNGLLYIRGDFNLVSGTIKEGSNDSATSTGRIWFTNTGAGKLHTFKNTGTIANRIWYRLVQPTDTLRIVDQSQLIGHTGSSLTVSGGYLLTENTDPDGAIQLGSGSGNGSIRVATRTFSTGSTIIYGGLGTQYIGNGHPSTVHAIIDNSSGVALNNTTTTTVTLASLRIVNGDLTVENDNLSVNVASASVDLEGGDLILSSVLGTRSATLQTADLNGGNIIVNSGAYAATLTISGTLSQNIGDITLNSGTADASLRLLGDFIGTGGNFFFTGDNNRLFVLGSGSFTRQIPLTEPTLLKFVGVNRSGETVTFPEAVTVTTDVSIPAGTLEVADMTIMGDLNINTGGYLDFSNSTLEIQSQFNTSYTGGKLIGNSSSILLMTGTGAVGTIAFDASGNALSKLVLDRPTSGTLLTLNSTLTVYDSIKLLDGIFSNVSGLAAQPDLVFVRHSDASMSGAGATGGPYNLFLEGTTLTTGSEILGSIQHLTSNVTGTATLNNPIALSGDLTNNSGTFTSDANAISAVLFTNNAVFNAPSSTLTLDGDFVNDGTFNRNSGTVRFNGISTISGTSSTIFHSLDITAQGDLTPPATLELTGNFNNDGIFNDNNGLILMSGSARQDITGLATTTVNNLTVSNTSAPYSVSVDGTVDLRGTLTLGPGAQFLADGVTTNGVFTVLSVDDQPSTVDGRIATIPASAAVLGNVTVQRFMSGKTTRVNRYISSPVTGATVSQITSDYDVSEVKWYDETVTGDIANGYVTVTDGDVLESGKGYLALPVTANVTATWDVRGPLTTGENQGSVDFGITHTASSPVDVNGDGWNLVGNPYASGIGWGINSGWTRSGIGATITVRDLGGPSPKYKQYTYNGTDGTGTLPNGVIAMGQAFWVWAAQGGGTLIVHESAKTAMSGTFYRERSPLSKQLIIALKNANGDEDNTFLKTNSAATEDFDIDFDAYQLKNEFLNISIYDKNSRGMLMHTLSEIPEDFVASVEIAASAPGQYTVSFEHAEEFLSGSEMYFVDELEQVATPIHVSGSSYTFNIQSTAVDNSRFRLKRKAEFENKGEFSVQVFPNPVSSELVVRAQGAKEVAVAVMDMKGNVLLQRAGTHEAIFNLSDLPKGMYIVRLVSQDNVVVRKIIKE
jgi:hypothetical protein